VIIVIHHSRRARMHLALGDPRDSEKPLRVLLGQVLAKTGFVRRGDQAGRRRAANDCDIDSARLVVVAREQHEFQEPRAASGATAAAAWAVSSQSAAIALAIGASASCTAGIVAAYDAAPPPLIARVTQCRCFVARSVSLVTA